MWHADNHYSRNDSNICRSSGKYLVACNVQNDLNGISGGPWDCGDYGSFPACQVVQDAALAHIGGPNYRCSDPRPDQLTPPVCTHAWTDSNNASSTLEAAGNATHAGLKVVIKSQAGITHGKPALLPFLVFSVFEAERHIPL